MYGSFGKAWRKLYQRKLHGYYWICYTSHKFGRSMKNYLDHHNENYVGLEGYYNGMDANDYAFEESLKKLEK